MVNAPAFCRVSAQHLEPDWATVPWTLSESGLVGAWTRAKHKSGPGTLCSGGCVVEILPTIRKFVARFHAVVPCPALDRSPLPEHGPAPVPPPE